MFVSWLAKYQWKKMIEHYKSVGAWAHKVGKVVSLWTLIFLKFGDCEKDKLHILKKVGLSTFKEILLKCVYNTTSMAFKVFLFCLKEFS